MEEPEVGHAPPPPASLLCRKPQLRPNHPCPPLGYQPGQTSHQPPTKPLVAHQPATIYRSRSPSHLNSTSPFVISLSHLVALFSRRKLLVTPFFTSSFGEAQSGPRIIGLSVYDSMGPPPRQLFSYLYLARTGWAD
ncbi:hypothetical protein BGX38DRAFT_1228489 [Terfezia claveryi]|nr:hypothetical protein BGX38DRAFT_1228489 [Terfezia claveryi]